VICAGLQEKWQDAQFAARLPGATNEAALGLAEGAAHLHMCVHFGLLLLLLLVMPSETHTIQVRCRLQPVTCGNRRRQTKQAAGGAALPVAGAFKAAHFSTASPVDQPSDANEQHPTPCGRCGLAMLQGVRRRQVCCGAARC
jgi:hypothetical protein